MLRLANSPKQVEHSLEDLIRRGKRGKGSSWWALVHLPIVASQEFQVPFLLEFEASDVANGNFTISPIFMPLFSHIGESRKVSGRYRVSENTLDLVGMPGTSGEGMTLWLIQARVREDGTIILSRTQNPGVFAVLTRAAARNELPYS